MKKILTLFIISLFGTSFLSSLEITVLDKDLGTPLEGVRLSVSNGKILTTDDQGKAQTDLQDTQGRVFISAQFPGYEAKKVWLNSTDKSLTISLVVTGVVEGKELVVEGTKPQKTDAQAGVSLVATKEEIRSTGEIGIVEDVMSTIKVLPGVGYVGGWNAGPSIRGGDPGETTAVLDGSYVTYPYHWGGAFSIFNPDMVESAKLSNGLISAKYGQVMSGLLEVTSKTPQLTQVELNTGLSTTGADLFLQAPLAKDAGILIGGKITWMEVSMTMFGLGDKFYTFPYIRDGYSKVFWKPTDRLEWFANTFIGSDGIKTKDDSKDQSSSFTTKGYFEWTNNTLMASTGLKWLLGEDQLLSLGFTYNRVENGLNVHQVTNGTKDYTPDFMTDNAALIAATNPGATSFTLSNIENNITTAALVENYQGRINWDAQITDGQMLTFGTDAMLTFLNDKEDVSIWTDSFATGVPVFTLVNPLLSVKNNRSLISAIYGIYAFDFSNGLVKGEVGLRGDHVYLYNDNFSLQTMPTVNPRLRVTWTPLKNQGPMEALSFTAGSGLFAQASIRTNLFDPKYGFKDFEITPDRAWFNLLGMELLGQDGWKFSVEAYYKSYFNRLFVTMDDSVNPVAYGPHTNGTGYAYGVDFLLQKRTSRYLDGWLTYSFTMARFLNPAAPAYEGNTAVVPNSAPLDTWYYPSYHRFHNLNLILNWKPLDGLTITTKAAVATGAPKKSLGPVKTYASVYGSQVIQRYAQSSSYSDDLRNDISCPLDVKITWSGYFPDSKVRWETYLGVENLLANLYTPKSNKSFDPYTGGELTGSGEADFTIGAPLPSFGFKISY